MDKAAAEIRAADEGRRPESIRNDLWEVLLVLGAVILSAFLRFSIFPPLSFAEGAYFFLIPLLLVNWTRQPKILVFGWGWLAGFLFWASSLIWLRHVTWGGTVGLAGVLACFTGFWLLFFAKILQTREWGSGSWRGWLIPLIAAASWVVLEWVRSWLFWGFPWNPISVSQWNRPAVLSLVSVTGGWGLSFLLIWINVGLAQWMRSPFLGWKKKGYLPVARKIPLALVVPVGVLLATAAWYFWQTLKRVESEPVRVGFVQPYSTMKWEATEVTRNLQRLWNETRSLHEDDPAIILWPESATPIPVIGEVSIQQGVEALAAEMDVPILMGNMADYSDQGVYENAVFLVVPDAGLLPESYAKRKLVPFGEFIPFREWLPFLEKVVPIGLDCRPGEEAVVFPFPTRDPLGGEDRIGPLICYEDVFPSLARTTVLEGADWLFVATNNVWYGEEAGAYQHAAHSVLRAVETRRPVLRSGNAGWSGWIDEWGNVRRQVSNSRGSIYFQGAEVVPVRRDLRFDGFISPYVRFGDWFVAVSALILILGTLGISRKRT